MSGLNSVQAFRKLHKTLGDAELIEIDNFYFMRVGGRLFYVRGEA